MQIEKNIAAMLQSKMKETGKTKLEFSKELGIPRSTLQGYLKGDKCLRSDSIEEIAKRLDLSPAQLIYTRWSGRYDEKGRTLYINDGTGYVAFPMRLGAWPEITLITLKRCG